MTDEEKEAIKKLDFIASECELEFKRRGYECNLYDGDNPIPHKEYRVLLNLIQKQNKIIKGNECVIETMTHNEEVLLEVIEKKDKIIDKMANEIYIEHNPHFKTTEEVIKYFEKEED